MAKFFDRIQPQHLDFIERQKMFFTATAPLDAAGHINLSPKGLNSFKVLSPNRVAYMDIIGSGNETSAHLLENSRITFMFCAFEGSPNILRLYGSGPTILPYDTEWNKVSSYFELHLATRQIITADIYQVQTSCGFSVPYYDYVGERDTAAEWAAKKGEAGLALYKMEKNRVSLDGLPTAMF